MKGKNLYSLALKVDEVYGLKDGVEDVMEQPFEDYEVKKVEVRVVVGRCLVWNVTKDREGVKRLWIKNVEGGRWMFESRKFIESWEVNVLKNYKRVYCEAELVGRFKKEIMEEYIEKLKEEKKVLDIKEKSVLGFYKSLK